MRIAILTSVFVPEFGVARVIASQLAHLVKAGICVDLYACELDRGLLCEGVRAVRVPTHLRGLRRALLRGRYDVIVAHTDPFYKFLAENDFGAVTVGYEHGYPPVDLCLPEEREQRLSEIGDRLGKIYPALSCVVTISNYAVDYLQWPSARVIYNGADHYCGKTGSAGNAAGSAENAENAEKAENAAAPVTVLAVSRFRKEEWQYKGIGYLCRLKQDLGERVKVLLVGRGDSESTEKLRQSGVEVVGMVSEQKLAELYRSCDALVSFSQWELFNLPLAEAGFAHKPALAFNHGPHAEVSLFAFDTYEEIRDYLKNSTRESRYLDGEKMFAHVDAHFRWEYNGEKFVALLKELCAAESGKKASPMLALDWLKWNAREFLRKNIYKKLRGRR
ncbi:MAG: glycosyltransferase family 4 protein [Fibrobacter sp.]|uniref:glycosyltransferase family 4 protein n=1 Tax=Fibrobacter sp. TaxID=35828 RepID=UPI0038906CC2|nr:glycosyltransferase family 4 protein [Fibrobacter sp.]